MFYVNTMLSLRCVAASLARRFGQHLKSLLVYITPGHFHDDFPEKCEKHGKWNTIVSMASDGSMQRREQETTPIPAELQKIIEENQR